MRFLMFSSAFKSLSIIHIDIIVIHRAAVYVHPSARISLLLLLLWGGYVYVRQFLETVKNKYRFIRGVGGGGVVDELGIFKIPVR